MARDGYDQCGPHLRMSVPNEMVSSIMSYADDQTLDYVSMIPELSLYAEKEKVLRYYPQAAPILAFAHKVADTLVALAANDNRMSAGMWMQTLFEAGAYKSVLFRLPDRSPGPKLVHDYITFLEGMMPPECISQFTKLTAPLKACYLVRHQDLWTGAF